LQDGYKIVEETLISDEQRELFVFLTAEQVSPGDPRLRDPGAHLVYPGYRPADEV
jgi:hypothetical protein